MARRTRVRKAEGRPSAKKRDVLDAVRNGTLGSLLIKKKVSLNVAIEVRDEYAKFLYFGDVERLKADPRFDGLLRHIATQTNAATPRQRRIGEKQKYKVQHNQQRKTSYIVVPVETLKENDDDELSVVEVSFEKGRIVLVKTTTEAA